MRDLNPAFFNLKAAAQSPSQGKAAVLGLGGIGGSVLGGKPGAGSLPKLQG